MTKRELVKWLSGKKHEARCEALTRKNQILSDLTYKKCCELGLEEILPEAFDYVEKLTKVLSTFVNKVNAIEGAGFDIYWSSLYGSLCHVDTIEKLRRYLKDCSQFGNVADYKELKDKLTEEQAEVADTYDIVINTVKNLPNAKLGVEYLTKLGFDVSEISKKEDKQLPATTDINVNVNYLMLKGKKAE